MAPKRIKKPLKTTYDDVDPQTVEAEFLASIHNGVSPPRTESSKMDQPLPRTLKPMTDELSDIKEFAQKLGFLIRDRVSHLAPHLMLEQFSLVRESVDTLWQGVESQDMSQLALGLIDIVYKTKLVALALGLPWEQLWEEVHLANLEKVLGPGKEGRRVDAVPPPGWHPPALAEILTAAGYKRSDWFDRQGRPKVERWVDHP